MDVSLEYVISLAIRQAGLIRAQFDALPGDQQEDIIALYLAEQNVSAWQNRREILRMKTR